MVTGFSAEDKSSGVKFCTVVHPRPGPEISHFGELYSREAQNRTNRQRRWALASGPPVASGREGQWSGSQCAGHAHPHVNITIEMCRRKGHAKDAPFVKSRGV